MTANDRPYPDDTARGIDEDTTGGPDADEPREEGGDGSPYTWPPWGAGWGWWPSDYWASTEETRGTPADAETVPADAEVAPADEDETWLDEGAFTVLIVVGVALFLFPEPGTSAIGVLLMLAGGFGWLLDAVT